MLLLAVIRALRLDHLDLAFHVALGQGRALIGQGGLITHQRQAARKTALTKRLQDLRAGLAAADDDNALCLSSRHSGPHSHS